jgi:hypothetical protein
MEGGGIFSVFYYMEIRVKNGGFLGISFAKVLKKLYLCNVKSDKGIKGHET